MREGDVPSFDFETSKTPKIVISITLMKVCQRSIIVSEEWEKILVLFLIRRFRHIVTFEPSIFFGSKNLQISSYKSLVYPFSGSVENQSWSDNFVQMRKGNVSLSSSDFQRTNITDNVNQYSYLRLFTNFREL